MDHLKKYLQKNWEYGIRLNLIKYTFADTSSTLLDHIVCEEGLLVDPIKIKAIISLLRLKRRRESMNSWILLIINNYLYVIL